MATTLVSSDKKVERDRLWERYLTDRSVQLRNEIALANKGIIGFALKDMTGKVNADTYDELGQEAWIGLLSAVELFDPSKGYAFSTYAVVAIHRRVQRYFQDHGSMIRMPVCRHEAHYFLEVAEHLFLKTNGELPENDAALADFMGCTVGLIQEVRENCSLIAIDSIDAPFSEGDDRSLADTLEGNPMDDPLEIMIGPEVPKGVDPEMVVKAIDSLDGRSRAALLMSANDLTLQEIGDQYRITRERVRQIIFKAIQKCRIFLGIDPNLPIRSLRLLDQETKVKAKRRSRVSDLKEHVRHKVAELGGEEIAKLPGGHSGLGSISTGTGGYFSKRSARSGPRLPREVVNVLAKSKPSRCIALRQIKKRYLTLSESELQIAELIWTKLPAEGHGEINLTLLATEKEMVPNLIYRQVSALIGKQVIIAHGRGRYERCTDTVLVTKIENDEKVFAEIDLATGSQISIIRPDNKITDARKEFSDNLLESLGIKGFSEEYDLE